VRGGEEKKERMSASTKRVAKRTCATGGKKGVWERDLKEIQVEREARYGTPGEEIRERILDGVKPVRETKSVKRSGRAQQVPKRVKPSRGRSRGSTWLEEAGKKRAKKRGRPRKEGRRRELARAYEDRRAREGPRGQGWKLQSEPLQLRDRRHRAAKANRVNLS
jgi:ribosomal protein S7